MPAESSSSPPTPRLDASARRESILDAAELQFVQRGLHATGTRDLARSAGVSEPVLYRHFESKETLFIAVVTRMLDQGIDQLSTSKLERDIDIAIRRALEALLLVDASSDVPAATEVVRERLESLEAAVGSVTGVPGPEALRRKLGEVVLKRFEQD